MALTFTALAIMMRHGPDEAAAAAVSTFAGDINGAWVDVGDFDEYATLLWLAVKYSRLQTIAALAARGDCNPNIPKLWTSTPLQFAVWYGDGDGEVILNLLLVSFPNLDVNARDGGGYTALHVAARLGAQACIRLLLNAGANPLAVTNWGATPALTARTYDKFCAEKLLEAAMVSTRTAWMTACIGVQPSKE